MLEYFRKKKTISDLKVALPRAEIIRRSRILFIDDEKPELIGDLQNAGFSVDHEEDISSENLSIFEGSRYDLVLLDFGNVGTKLGKTEGLGVLRTIRNMDPSIVVFTYTSKALGTEFAEFYRLADGTLAKDAGIDDSIQIILDALKQSHSIENVWKGLLAAIGVAAGSELDLRLQDRYVRGLDSQPKLSGWKTDVIAMVTSEPGKSISQLLVGKLIELGMKSVIG